MTIYLKQSTASQEVALGFFVDSTDGNTEETGLTIANTDIKIHKMGATTLANKNSGGATHISNGVYYAVLDATDTDTLGPLVIYCHPSGALAVRVECCVLAANVYDSLIGGGDILDVSMTQILGTAVATPSVAGVLEVDLTHVAGATTDVSALATNVAAILVDTGTTLDAAIAAVKSDTAAILTDTGTTLDAAIAAVKVDTAAILVDTGTTLDAAIAAVKADTAAILTDTGTTLDAAIAAVKSDTAAILIDTGTTLDGNITAIKAKTDSLAFTVAGQVDSNVQYVNDVALQGVGTVGDSWRPA